MGIQQSARLTFRANALIYIKKKNIYICIYIYTWVYANNGAAIYSVVAQQWPFSIRINKVINSDNSSLGLISGLFLIRINKESDQF